MKNQDEQMMSHALALAAKAEAAGEVPVGAVIVYKNNIIAEGWNQPISAHDPTAHAEVIAMRAAAQHLNNYRLVDTTLYVTLQPCVMCMGAMVHARITRLVYGAHDSKSGEFNHEVSVEGGILEVECSKRLKEFFQRRR